MSIFEWDPRKARSNEKKHGVSFADAATVLDDDLAITIEDPDIHEGEQRFVTLAVDSFGVLLVVVYTWRGENIRIISARKATRLERRRYEGVP